MQAGIGVQEEGLELDFSRYPRVYIVSDLHLGHANIIRYCERPFSNVGEMNATLIRNWNAVIGNKDTVYFLGDLAFGRNATDFWLSQLNGNITFIKGNHDRSKSIPFLDHAVVQRDGMQFYLVHHPYRAPKDWSDWTVHGHVHNNNPVLYPFINREKRTVNASIEMTGYRPISLDDIVKEIRAEGTTELADE